MMPPNRNTINEKIQETMPDFFHPWREKYYSGEPLRIGNSVQLLLDDYIIEDRFGLKRVIGPIRKYSGNPLDTGPPLWRKDEISSFLEKEDDFNSETDYVGWVECGFRDVIYDPEEEVYKAYYAGPFLYRENFPIKFSRSTSYLESRDGISWEKPELDLFPFAGKKNTNIVLLAKRENGNATLGNVILKPAAENGERRFTAISKMIPPGEKVGCIVQLFSPDGRKWSLAPDPVLFRGVSDGAYNLVYDPARKCWLLYRRPATHALIGMSRNWTESSNKHDKFYSDFHDCRRVSVAMSKDLKNWTHPRSVALPDEIDLTDIDSVQVIKYRDIFIGFIVLMDNTQTTASRHTQLMWSRDGLRWERLPDRPRFINVKSMLHDGDRINIYYDGELGGTNLAFIGKDRFVGQQAGAEGGYLLIRQFILEGDKLEINCYPQGRLQKPNHGHLTGLGRMIKAELLQPPVEHYPAEAYPGFTMDECDLIPIEDEMRHVVKWNGSADLSSLRGQAVYIRFYLRNATLFSFRIAT